MSKNTPFRRLEERERTTAPLMVAWGAGLALGALGGVAALAWEAALLHATGVGLAYGGWWLPVLLIYAGVGGFVGLASGSAGLWGPRWSLAASITGVAWLVSPKFAAGIADAGAPPFVGVLFVMGVVLLLSQLAGRLPSPPWLAQGVSAFLLVGAPPIVALHEHLVSASGDAGAVLVTMMLALVAAALAGVTAVLTGEGRAPVLPLIAALVLGGGLAALLVGRTAPGDWGTSEVDGPKVVLVVVSGLREDRTGFGGHGRGTTPNLDGLARKSLVFGGAHATSNWSVPSIASMLTARHPYMHGAGLSDGSRNRHTALRPDVPTLAQVAGAGGFPTAAVVGDPMLRRYALDTGFGVWWDAPERGVVPAALLPIVISGFDPTHWPRRVQAELVTERAVDLLSRAPTGGWLLMVQYADAGGPFEPTAEDERALGFTTRPWPADRYDAAVRRVDRALGDLIAAVPPDAWLVVVGDRGVQLGEERPAHSLGRPGVRFGATMFEEILHVPLLVRAPGIGAGRVPESVSVVDLTPTLLRAMGLPEARRADGVPLDRAFGSPQQERAVIAQSSLFGGEQQAAIVGRHKLVHTPDDRTPLYDLHDDPAEASPLRTGSETDNLERRMLALLPPPGAGIALQEAPSAMLRFGQLASRVGPRSGR